MPFSHYSGLWKTIPHCLTQIQRGLAGRLLLTGNDLSGFQTVDVAYTGCASGDWRILGIGDFDGDQTDDLLLSDGVSLAGWKIVDGQRQTDFWFGTLLDDWQYKGIGDVNHDGIDDILLDNGDNLFAAWTIRDGKVSEVVAIA